MTWLAERFGAAVNRFVIVATCSTQGHDWRVWTVVGPVNDHRCERCGLVAYGYDDPQESAR